MAARDVVLIGILVFALATGMFIVHNVITKSVDTMTNIPSINESQLSKDSLTGVQNAINKLDYAVFLIFIGLALTLIITGWFVGGLPIFMGIYFLVIVIGVGISTVLANIWESITTTSALIVTLTSFPITNHILLKFPIYLAVVGFIGIVVMFGKPYFMGEA